MPLPWNSGRVNPNILWKDFWSLWTLLPSSVDSCWYMSFSPCVVVKEALGYKIFTHKWEDRYEISTATGCQRAYTPHKAPTHPSRMAILMKPNLFFSIRSEVPGCAFKLSAAPPTTIVIALPGPLRKICSQLRLVTLHIPMACSRSR